MTAAGSETAVDIQLLSGAHVAAVSRIDALHTGAEKRDYWDRIFTRFLAHDDPERIGIGTFVEGTLHGYLFGEVRAFEFGSDPCGWIFALWRKRPLLYSAATEPTNVFSVCRLFEQDQHSLTVLKLTV